MGTLMVAHPGDPLMTSNWQKVAKSRDSSLLSLGRQPPAWWRLSPKAGSKKSRCEALFQEQST